ncbi:MAG: flavin reductase family protein [Actinomycetes bacterium]
MPPTPDEFREAVSRFASGITVVTCVVDGVDHAMTANAFASVSLNPLLVMVCVERESRFHAAISATHAWGVSILAADGEHTSRWFATKGRPLQGQLERSGHHRSPRHGVAWIDGALGSLECHTHDIRQAGDHDIVVGEVVELEVSAGLVQDPLLYFRRGYHSLGADGNRG